MKRLMVYPCKYRLGFLVAALLSFNGAVYAVDATITKTDAPDVITVISIGGTGLSFFGLRNTDFSDATAGRSMKLRGIEWRTTSYPQTLDEKVELCYFRPFQGLENNCRPIWPSMSGTLHDFDDLPFGSGASVTIKHHVKDGGTRLAYPAGTDSVTYHYSY